MKKNDLMGYLVYVLMIAIALGVGLGVVRPIFSNTAYTNVLGGNVGIVFILLAVLGGIVLSALMVELGHLLGAKIGKYKVTSWNCLFFQFKKDEKSKTRFSFANYDGITGETKIVPLDVTKSNPRPYIYMPLLLNFLVIVICSILMAVSNSFKSSNLSWIWGYLIAVVVLAVTLMILLYDIFPAALDGKNDGYLIPILNNAVNVRAYNEMLLAQDKMSRGVKIHNAPVYEQVTDFTAKLNSITVYKRLSEGDYKGALEVNKFTINSKDKVSRRVYNDAVAQKTAIDLYTKRFAEAKEEYIALSLEEKKYIASLGSAPAVRAYILISGLIDESINETKAAMDRADQAIKASGEDKRPVEERLMKFAVQKVLKAHPDWDFSEYGKAFLPEKAATLESKEPEKVETETKKDGE